MAFDIAGHVEGGGNGVVMTDTCAVAEQRMFEAAGGRVRVLEYLSAEHGALDGWLRARANADLAA